MLLTSTGRYSGSLGVEWMMHKDLHQYESPEAFLVEFIPYLEATREEDWVQDVVRRGGQNCLMGHFINFCEHDLDDNVAPSWDWFEQMVATPYMVYPVNDGTDPDYPQGSARERCIAFMKDILSGTKPNTLRAMQEDYEEWKCRNHM